MGLIWRHKNLRDSKLRVCADSFDVDSEGVLRPLTCEGYSPEVSASLAAHPLFYSEVVQEPKPAKASPEPAAKKAATPKKPAAKKPARKRKTSSK